MEGPFIISSTGHNPLDYIFKQDQSIPKIRTKPARQYNLTHPANVLMALNCLVFCRMF